MLLTPTRGRWCWNTLARKYQTHKKLPFVSAHVWTTTHVPLGSTRLFVRDTDPLCVEEVRIRLLPSTYVSGERFHVRDRTFAPTERFVNFGADDTAKPHHEPPETSAPGEGLDWDSVVVPQQRRREPRPSPLNGPRAQNGVPAMVDEVRSAFGLVEDDALEASAELFRQSSSESEDASSIADDIFEESNEEELMADDVAIEPLLPERALGLTHTTFVAVVLRVVPPFEVTTGWKTRAVSSQLDTGVTRCIMESGLWADCRTHTHRANTSASFIWTRTGVSPSWMPSYSSG